MNTTFDTLTAAHSLEDAGIEPKQAEAIVAAIRSSRSEVITQGDLAAAVAELQASSKDAVAELKRDIAVLRFAVFTFGPVILGLLIKLAFFP